MAPLYRKRWTLETAFQPLEAYLHSAINTVGSPKAALWGFRVALVAYNVLAVVFAALRRVHGAATVEHDVSWSYSANALATPYTGMMMAIPEPEGAIVYARRTADLAALLRDLAPRVRLQALRKRRKRPQQARCKRPSTPKKGPGATAQ